MTDVTAANQRTATACVFCAADGGELVWRDDLLRVILPDEADYPGFTRVVWAAHVVEVTDLDVTGRQHLMSVVWRVEAAQREALAPDKINLASFGNMTPHLHWHVIPRYRDDRHFPEPVWGRPAGRDAAVAARARAVRAALPTYRAALLRLLG
ncbi:MAG TPA: HIT family protein [Burkholderiaceae bacterium]|nr:HIT family protein [Burkholderiaceae bacterium]